MGICSAQNQKPPEGNFDSYQKNYQSMHNDNTQVNSEQNTNRPNQQQPQQALGDQLLATQQILQQNNNNQLFQSQQIQGNSFGNQLGNQLGNQFGNQQQGNLQFNIQGNQQGNKQGNQFGNQQQGNQQGNQLLVIQQVNHNLVNKKIKQILQIADEFNLTLLKGQLIYMIHRECEQFRNFLIADNDQFEEYIQMFFEQRLEYLNYRQEQRNILDQINQQLSDNQRIIANNKFVGQRKIQLIKRYIRNEELLIQLKALEYSPQEKKVIKVEILKAIDLQINQIELNRDNLKKLLFIKEFYVCLLREANFTQRLEEVDIEQQMLNF